MRKPVRLLWPIEVLCCFSVIQCSRDSNKMDVKFVFLIYAIVLACVFFTSSQGQRREFQVCKAGATKAQDHICLRMNSCPSAVAGLKKGVIPKICGYNKNIPLVCCAPDGPIRRSAKAIIDEKCNKFKEAQYRLEQREGPFPGDPPYSVNVTDCTQQEILIVGGVPAVGREFPHMALIGYGDTEDYREWKCGGTLISERFVLTAGHCLVGSAGQPTLIRLGELNYENDTDDARPVDFGIAEFLLHPNYSHPIIYNDIALIKLDRDVKFNAYMRPICLDTAEKVTETKSVATGWGITGVGDPTSEHLMKVTLPFLPVSVCQTFFKTDVKFRNGILGTTQLCAGEMKGKKDSCVGDSGGPLQIFMGGEPCMYVQLGITSHGDKNCGIEKQPAIYTKVSAYLDWIQEKVWPQP